MPWRPISVFPVSGLRWRWGCQPHVPGALYSPETILYVSNTHFCWRLSKHQGLVRVAGLGKLIKITSCFLEPATFRPWVPPPPAKVITNKTGNIGSMALLSAASIQLNCSPEEVFTAVLIREKDVPCSFRVRGVCVAYARLDWFLSDHRTANIWEISGRNKGWFVISVRPIMQMTTQYKSIYLGHICVIHNPLKHGIRKFNVFMGYIWFLY
jgi:hypothetical protein